MFLSLIKRYVFSVLIRFIGVNCSGVLNTTFLGMLAAINLVAVIRLQLNQISNSFDLLVNKLDAISELVVNLHIQSPISDFAGVLKPFWELSPVLVAFGQ